MERIKKTVFRATKQIVEGTDISIVPDTEVVYGFKILLTQRMKGLGFFDVPEDLIRDGVFCEWTDYVCAQETPPIIVESEWTDYVCAQESS